MSLLTFEDGQIVLGDYTLPGNFVGTQVGKSIRFDEQKSPNSGSRKVPLGWEDAAITVTLELTTEQDGQTCYDKLEELNGIFCQYDNKANPKVWDIDNRHLTARGIRRVIFSGLSSDETNQNDVIKVTLTFSEYYQAVVKLEKNVARGGSAQVVKQEPGNGRPNTDNKIMVDLR